MREPTRLGTIGRLRLALFGFFGAVALVLQVAFDGWKPLLALSVALLAVGLYGVYRTERVKQSTLARLDDAPVQSPSGSVAMLAWMALGGGSLLALWLLMLWRSGALAALGD